MPATAPDVLSPWSLQALLVSDAATPRRIRRAVHDGQTLWIKRYDAERRGVGHFAHRLLSRLVPISFWRASEPLGPQGMVARELRKSYAFRAAGIATPAILGMQGATLVIADVGLSADRVLRQLKREGDGAAHDALLVRLAKALGEMHGVGLCHGRPHPRDMAEHAGRIFFFDFEEEPEKVMPLADAQARDVWLMFLQITAHAIDPETPGRALAAYTAMAPVVTRLRLAAMVNSMRWVIPLGRAVSRVHLGSDLRRFLGATGFLAAAMLAPEVQLPDGMSDNISAVQSRNLGTRDAEEADEDVATD